MKRMHVHVAVEDIANAIEFYSALFATHPASRQDGLREMDVGRPPRQFRSLYSWSTAGAGSPRHPGRKSRGIAGSSRLLA
jgi:hypothetical protein